MKVLHLHLFRFDKLCMHLCKYIYYVSFNKSKPFLPAVVICGVTIEFVDACVNIIADFLTATVDILAKITILFYSSSFIMEPEPKLRIFFGSGSGQKGRLRNSAIATYLQMTPKLLVIAMSFIRVIIYKISVITN